MLRHGIFVWFKVCINTRARVVVSFFVILILLYLCFYGWIFSVSSFSPYVWRHWHLSHTCHKYRMWRWAKTAMKSKNYRQLHLVWGYNMWIYENVHTNLRQSCCHFWFTNDSFVISSLPHKIRQHIFTGHIKPTYSYICIPRTHWIIRTDLYLYILQSKSFAYICFC